LRIKKEKTKDCELDGSKYTNKHCRSSYCYILKMKKKKTKDCELDGSKYTNRHCRSSYCYILRIKKKQKYCKKNGSKCARK
jgi:hypothetical protein